MSTVEEAQKQQAQDQNAQKLQVQYNQYNELIAELQSQLSTISSQIQEHIIVDKSLTSIPPEKRAGRKCFKMIGGVLVDKTIDEVIKILNHDLNVMKDQQVLLDKELVQKRKDMETWMTKNNVKIVRNWKGKRINFTQSGWKIGFLRIL